MPYRDLITFDWLMAANSGEVVTALDELKPEAEAVITAVSSYLRGQLGRVLIVEAVTQRVAPHDWMEDRTTWGSQVYVHADHPPPVQAESATIQTGGRLIKDRPEPGALQYVGGFRRPDQVLGSPGPNETALPAGTPSGMADLSELPPTLPEEVADVTANLCLHVLSKREDELGKRTTRQIGGQEIVTEAADTGFTRRQVSRLEAHDRSHVLRGPVETTPLTEA